MGSSQGKITRPYVFVNPTDKSRWAGFLTLAENGKTVTVTPFNTKLIDFLITRKVFDTIVPGAIIMERRVPSIRPDKWYKMTIEKQNDTWKDWIHEILGDTYEEIIHEDSDKIDIDEEYMYSVKYQLIEELAKIFPGIRG